MRAIEREARNRICNEYLFSCMTEDVSFMSNRLYLMELKDDGVINAGEFTRLSKFNRDLKDGKEVDSVC